MPSAMTVLLTAFTFVINVLQKKINQGLYPLHARVMCLFENLRKKNNHYGMDNLYTSAKFICCAYTRPKDVMCHRFFRKSGRGVPSSVLQEEVKNRKLQLKVRGMVRAEILKK